MHSCLEIDEIVTAICSYLVEKDLLPFALACKRLSEPALSLLWRDLSDLEPFMKLFPEDAWYGSGELFQKGRIWQHDNPMMLKRTIAPIDWQPTVPYASYVRTLALKCDGIQSPLLNSAAQAFASDHVFPNLQRLFVLDTVDSYLPFIRLTLSPNLTYLLLNLDPTPNVLSMVSQLGTWCPSIISFRFSWIGRHRSPETLLALVESISQAVLSWRQLKSLSVAGLAPHAMEHISRLANLEEVALYRDITLKLHPDHAVAHPGFQSLCRFQLFDWPVDCITRFLQASRTSGLDKFRILLPHHPKAEEWPDFFRTVTDRSSEAGKLEIYVRTVEVIPPPPTADHPFLIGVEALRPLLLASNLAALDLSNMYHFSLTDGFIEELARASPLLTLINIGTERTTGRSPTLTLEAYRHILVHCPRISTLGLVVDTSNTREATEPKPREGSFPWPGRGENFCFYVGDSVATNPIAVAAFLSPFFDKPVAQWCIAENATYNNFHGWNEVFNYMLPAYINGERPPSPYCDHGARVIMEFVSFLD